MTSRKEYYAQRREASHPYAASMLLSGGIALFGFGDTSPTATMCPGDELVVTTPDGREYHFLYQDSKIVRPPLPPKWYHKALKWWIR